MERAKDLTPDQMATVYKAYFDDTLHTVGGGAALDKLDPASGAALADTTFRHGRGEGAELIQEAINKTNEGSGKPDIPKDSQMGPQTMKAYGDLKNTPSFTEGTQRSPL